eukprot:s228_g37.t1
MPPCPIFDDMVAEYVESLWEDGAAKSAANYAVASIQFHRPETKHHLPWAWKLVRVWNQIEVPQRATPLTTELLMAFAGQAFKWRQYELGWLFVIGFTLFLRTGELLQIRAQDVAMNQHTGVLYLPPSKGGKRLLLPLERVELGEAITFRAFRELLKAKKPGDYLWPYSRQKCWRQEAENEDAAPQCKIRVSSDPERVTFELHANKMHCLLCGDLSEEWQPAPPQASTFQALTGKDGKGLGLEAPLMWRHCWADGHQGRMTGWFKAGSSRGSPPTIAPGELAELVVYDDAGNEQGSVLVGMLEDLGKHKDGRIIAAMFLAASDVYYHWWMNEGPNAPQKDRGAYHLCSVPAAKCPGSKKHPTMVHSDKYRVLGSGPVTSQKVPWLKDKALREGFEFCLKKFHGVMGGPEAELREAGSAMKRPRAAWADKPDPSEEGDTPGEGDSDEEDETSSEDEAMAAKIKKLRKELKKAEDDAAAGKKRRKGMKKTRAPAIKDKKPKAKQKKRDKDDPSKKEKKKGKDAKKKKKKSREADSEDEESATRPGPSKAKKKRKTASGSDEDDDSEGSDGDLFGVKAVDKGATKVTEGDRGPFGGGPPVKLLAYTNRYPGRLASRMLLKMEQAVARGTVGPMVGEGRRTPPVALNHILTVLLPSLGQKAGLRSTRELKTLGTILDQLASGAPSRAADTVTQRIKAVERATHEGHWGSAQHLELLAPENSMLIDKDEEMFVTREFLLEQRLKQYDRPGPRRDGDGKGKSKGAKGKTKDGTKGDRPNWDKTDKGPKKPEAK